MLCLDLGGKIRLVQHVLNLLLDHHENVQTAGESALAGRTPATKLLIT
jgi:hypothetical protein